MAKGYWGPPNLGCPCCSSGPKSKFLCEACLHVCKAPQERQPALPGRARGDAEHGPALAPGEEGQADRTAAAPVMAAAVTGAGAAGEADGGKEVAMATTIKPVRRNGGYCICAERLEGDPGVCRYGCCTEFRCPVCRGKLGGWGPVGCRCEGGPRWARHPGMRDFGHWDYEKDDYVQHCDLVKPSLLRRGGKR